MFCIEQRIRVEWAHCDPAGIIFNPHYYIWMNGATHALIQSAGFDFIGESNSASGFASCPLVASQMTFRQPLYFGDVVTLISRVEKFGNTSFVAAHEFSLPASPEPVAKGTEVRVWANKDPGDPKKMIARPVPESVKAMLTANKKVSLSI